MRRTWSLTLVEAQLLIMAAHERASVLGISVAVAVVDGGGTLIALERADGTQLAGPDVAIAKARAAALFRRPTTAFEQVAQSLDKPSVLLLTSAVPHALPVAGGVPVLAEAEVAGAVGVSGGSGDQDDDVARFAVSALAPSTDPEAVRLPH